MKDIDTLPGSTAADVSVTGVGIFDLCKTHGCELIPSVYTYDVQSSGNVIYFNPRMERSALERAIVAKISSIQQSQLPSA